MKILFLSLLPYPPNAGGRMRGFALLKYFATRGSVSLLAEVGGGLNDSEYSAALNQYSEKSVFVVRGDRRIPIPGFWWKDRVSGFLATVPWELGYAPLPEFERKLSEIKLETFDLIVANRICFAEYLVKLKNGNEFLNKTIVDVDDVILRQYEQRAAAAPSLSKRVKHSVGAMILKRHYKNILARVHSCFVASHIDREYLLKNGISKRVFLIPNSIEVDNCKSEALLSSGPPNLMFVGSLDYWPNEEAVIFFCERIWPIIKKRIPDVRFTVVGSGLSTRILSIIEKQEIDLAGFVPSVGPFYEKATLCVVPLLNGTGTRIKILEAMAYRRPVVSTAIGCEGLHAVHGENILIADDAERFAECCVKLIQNVHQREYLANNAFEFVKRNYDSLSFKKAMEDFCNSYENRHNRS